MTRKEEIEEQANGMLIMSWPLKTSFIKMAEWADETMLDKIEKILLSKVLPCFMHGGDAGDVIAMLEEKLEEQS